MKTGSWKGKEGYIDCWIAEMSKTKKKGKRRG
jgi:hypothetical protein